MHIVARTRSILDKINCTHFYNKREEKLDTYIIFYLYDEKGVQYTSGNENITAFYIQISIFSKDEVKWLDLQEQVREKFKNEDWILDDVSPDMFEEKTDYNHKAFRFIFYQNNKMKERNK